MHQLSDLTKKKLIIVRRNFLRTKKRKNADNYVCNSNFPFLLCKWNILFQRRRTVEFGKNLFKNLSKRQHERLERLRKGIGIRGYNKNCVKSVLSCGTHCIKYIDDDDDDVENT